jgi:aspartyl-tRNA synthetase
VRRRKEIEQAYRVYQGQIGGKGIAWIKITGEGISSSFSKFLTPENRMRLSPVPEHGKATMILIISDADDFSVLTQLGSLRTELAGKLGLIPKGVYNLL